MPTQMVSCALLSLYIINVIAFAGQIISTPILIDAFKEGNSGVANPYFVTILSAFSQCLICLVYYLCTCPNCSSRFNLRSQWQLMKLGFFWAIAYIVLAMVSSGDRTPVDLQAIFSQSNIPLTLLLTHFYIRRPLTPRQLWMSLIVVAGTLFTLIPIFISLKGDHADDLEVSLLWCVIYLLGSGLNSFSIVYNDKIMPTVNVTILELNLWANFYQLLTSLAFFWVGFLPWLGISSSFHQWQIDMSDSFSCFILCSSPAYKALIFVSFVTVNCVTGTAIIKYQSANHLTLISSLAPPLSLTYWSVFSHISALNMIFNYIGAVIIIGGIIYGHYDTSRSPSEHLREQLLINVTVAEDT